MSRPDATVGSSRDRGALAWYALGALSVVTLFALIDRTIFPLLAEPIKAAMGLSDLQLGLLQGTGIAIFAGLASYPLGWISDRFDRRLVLAGCLLTWSLAVLGCGLAENFTQLLIASAMVGAGEAGLTPIVFSMIPDLFPERRRQLANSIFAVAATAAGGLAYAISGQLIGLMEAVRPHLPAALQALNGWRLAFLAAASPAPLMLLLIATVPLPTRGGAPRVIAKRDDAPSVLPYLRAHWRTLAPFMLGIGVAVFAFGATGSWLAVILMRLFHQTAAQIGAVVAPLTLVSTAASFFLSVVVVRRFAARLGDVLPVRALWVSYLAAAAGNLTLVFTSSSTQFYVVAGLGATLTAAAGMLYPTALQSMAPARLRARLIALQSIVSLAFGAAAAPTVGLVSDHLHDIPMGLLYAALGVATPAMLAAALLLRASEKTIGATTEAARRIDTEATEHTP